MARMNNLDELKRENMCLHKDIRKMNELLAALESENKQLRKRNRSLSHQANLWLNRANEVAEAVKESENVLAENKQLKDFIGWSANREIYKTWLKGRQEEARRLKDEEDSR